MSFGHFVISNVQAGESVILEELSDSLGFASMLSLNADENLGVLGIGNTVIEFGDVAVAEKRNESSERTSFFRNSNGEKYFTMFTDFCTVCDETQSVEVHVGTG